MTNGEFVDISEADLRAYSQCRMTAQAIREAYDATFADILVGLAKYDLPLPVAPTAGREADIERARELLFPRAK